AGLRTLKIGLVAVVTLVAFESLAVTTILPDIEDDLGGIAWYGWVTTAFFLGTMIGIVFAGDQADRRGAGVPYAIGLTLFAIGLLIGGAAPDMPVLVLGRFVQGFGAGVVPAIGYVAIGRAFDVAQRPRMFAILSTAWVVPGLVGPVVAERVADGVGWRWVFLGLLPLVVVAGTLVLPAMMRLGPVTGGTSQRVRFFRRRLVEATRVAAGAAVAVAGFTGHRVLLGPALVPGAVLATGPFRRLTPSGTLRAARGLPAVILSRGVLTFAFFGLDAFVPFAITNGRGLSTLVGSVAVTVVTVSWTSAAWIQDRWIVRLGEARFIRAGYCSLAMGIAVVALGAQPDAVPYWLIHVGAVFGGFGMGLSYAAHTQLTLRSAPDEAVGSATASMQLSDNLGIALGTGVVGAIVAFGDDSGWAAGDAVAVAWMVPLSVALAGIILVSRFAPSRAARETPGRAPGETSGETSGETPGQASGETSGESSPGLGPSESGMLSP
ncbi:MAG: MFS transporter, partial [Ilumatobacter sp.]